MSFFCRASCFLENVAFKVLASNAMSNMVIILCPFEIVMLCKAVF